MPTITISLPDHIFQQVAQKSHRNQRTIADEVVATLLETMPATLPDDLNAHLAQLDVLGVEELLAAAQMTAPSEKAERMQALLDKQGLEGLLPTEAQEAQQLSAFFNQIMLVRAKSAVLLKRQGIHIDEPQNQP